jgi:hypothetical protein
VEYFKGKGLAIMFRNNVSSPKWDRLGPCLFLAQGMPHSLSAISLTFETLNPSGPGGNTCCLNLNPKATAGWQPCINLVVCILNCWPRSRGLWDERALGLRFKQCPFGCKVATNIEVVLLSDTQG